MKIILTLACCILMCGCAGVSRKGQARTDAFESVRFVQMAGNTVSGAPFQRTIVCLNARRETRFLPATTNFVVTYVTNKTISYFTNQASSIVTNYLSNIATNQLSPTAPPIPVDTNDIAAVTALTPAPGISTNAAVTRTADTTVTVNSAKDQSATTINTQSSVTFNSQFTTTLGNQATTVTTNQIVRNDSSITVTALTNYTAVPSTNAIIGSSAQWIHDHYLYTELTPPPEFVLAPGESLILLVDGQRHGFAPTNSPSFIGRRNFSSTLYRVPPEVIVAMANASSVKMRIRGTTVAIERELSRSSRENFAKFLLQYYSPKATMKNILSESPAPEKSKTGANTEGKSRS